MADIHFVNYWLKKKRDINEELSEAMMDNHLKNHFSFLLIRSCEMSQRNDQILN